MTDKSMSEKQQEKIEAALTIRSQLQQAFDKKKRVNIFAGTVSTIGFSVIRLPWVSVMLIDWSIVWFCTEIIMS